MSQSTCIFFYTNVLSFLTVDHLAGLRIFSVLLGDWIEAIKQHKFLICLFSNKKFYFFPAIIDYLDIFKFPYSIITSLKDFEQLLQIIINYQYTTNRDQTKPDHLVLHGGPRVRHKGGPGRVVPSVASKHRHETKKHVLIRC